MQQLQQLLRLYWSNEPSDATCSTLNTALQENSDEIMVDFKKSFGTSTGSEMSLSAETSANILEKIHQKISIQKKKKAVRVTRIHKIAQWTSAAAIIFISLFGLYQYFNLDRVSDSSIQYPDVKEPVLVRIANTSDTSQKLLLSDNSVVLLDPRSTLSFEEKFQPGYRSLNLNGSALFTVAEDSLRPFTVYANNVATTAVGTEFSINTFVKDNSVTVKLNEGKVVIRSANDNAGSRDIYLEAGQECTIKDGEFAPVVSYSKKETQLTRKRYRNDQISHEGDLRFFKESLSGIFKKIGTKFNVRINYNAAELQNLSFTGHFLPTDSLPIIMSVVCSTNDLSYNRDGDLITVKK